MFFQGFWEILPHICYFPRLPFENLAEIPPEILGFFFFENFPNNPSEIFRDFPISSTRIFSQILYTNLQGIRSKIFRLSCFRNSIRDSVRIFSPRNPSDFGLIRNFSSGFGSKCFWEPFQKLFCLENLPPTISLKHSPENPPGIAYGFFLKSFKVLFFHKDSFRKFFWDSSRNSLSFFLSEGKRTFFQDFSTNVSRNFFTDSLYKSSGDSFKNSFHKLLQKWCQRFFPNVFSTNSIRIFFMELSKHLRYIR